MKFNLILAIGGGSESVGFLVDLAPFLIKSFYIFAIAAVIGVTSFIVVHKSVRIYQHSLSRMVKKILNNKKAFENTEDPNKKDKLSKKHSKLIKKLDKKLKTIIRYNRKTIYIPSHLYSSQENLSIDPNNSFTFYQRLEQVKQKNKKYSKLNIKETDKNGKKATDKFDSFDASKEQQISKEEAERAGYNELLVEEFNTTQKTASNTKVETKTTKESKTSSTIIYKDNSKEDTLSM